MTGFKARPIDWIILALGTVLRTLKLNWPISGDECFTFLWYARHPIEYIVTTYNTPNNHILHSILMHVSYVLFGANEVMLRMPVFLAGVGSIVLIWVFAWYLTHDIWIARLAALFMALSGHFVTYSQSGRGYMLAAFFALAIATLAVSPIRLRWLWIGVLGFLLLYTLPSGIVFLIPFYVYALWKGWPKNVMVMASVTLMVLLATIAYFPAMDSLIAFSRGQQTAIIHTDLKAFFDELWTEAHLGVLNGPLLVFLMGLTFYILAQPGRIFFCLIPFSYLAVAVFLNPLAPFLIFYPRNFGVLYPFLYVLCAIGAVGVYRYAREKALHPIWCAILGGVMLMGAVETVVESISPTHMMFRTLKDARVLAREQALKTKPYEYMRGGALDGVALFEYLEYGPKVRLMDRIQAIYFFSENYSEVQAVCKLYPGLKVKPMKRRGSVVMYRLAS